MNWELVGQILTGIVALYMLCFLWAIVEGEIHKRKEAKKWQDWISRS